jgi:cell division protein FtsI (penicillin-binding protein 3)/stage V sporulation protein D (sporulation-specific penicillin-binding protein)
MSPTTSLGRKNTGRVTQEDLFKHNVRLASYFILFIALGVISMLFRWQVLEHDKWSTRATSQRTETQRQTSSRGVIYAADGTVLAIDEPAWDVYASLSTNADDRKSFFDNEEKYLTDVSAILNLSKETLKSKLPDDFVYVSIAKGINSETKDALSNVQISPDLPYGYGLYFIKVEKRVYPDKSLASQIIGFMGKDSNNEDVGQYGIEGYYFGDLQSQLGNSYEEKDSKGNVILTTEYDPILPRNGKSITLTIEPVIQKKVEEHLKSGVESTRSKSGTAIIMEPSTGKIIAMANYPSYDPNEYWKVSDPWIFKNKAVSDVYEFGSVQKPITIAIALESGKVAEDYICHDETGFLQLYDYKIWTWNQQANGDLTLSQILEKSNNPCASQVAIATGFDYYYNKLKEFGYGQFIGIGLQDEANSYLYPYENWTKLDLATSAFGQAISATSLQIISATNTIVNDGDRMRPYIVSEITDEKETITIEPKVEASPISAENAAKVRGMMRNVVRYGEAKRYFNNDLSDYDVAGKTGTAQIPKENELGYYDDRTNTIFVGFAPVDDAKMVMLVRLQEPQISTFSSYTVVPVWIDIFRAVANDLEIPKISY